MSNYSDETDMNSCQNILETILNEQSEALEDTNNNDNLDLASNKLDVEIDNAINSLEKILHLKALSDDEWSELHEEEIELHEDIKVLYFAD